HQEEFMRRSTAIPLPVVWCLVSLLGFAHTQRGWAVTLAVGSTSAAPGASTDVCIFMSGGAQVVAGVQLNLNWDGSCASVNSGDGISAQCRANPSTGKNVQTSVGKSPCQNDPNCLTALLFSMSDTAPIPDGQLFCCTFSVLEGASTNRCDV